MITEDGHYSPPPELELTAWTVSGAMRHAGARAVGEALARRYDAADTALYVYGAMRHNRSLRWTLARNVVPLVAGAATVLWPMWALIAALGVGVVFFARLGLRNLRGQA